MNPADKVPAAGVEVDLASAAEYAEGDLDVRLQVMDDGGWEVHTGDAQYDTDHRGYWGASIISADATQNDLPDIAKDLIEQAAEHYAQCQ